MRSPFVPPATGSGSRARGRRRLALATAFSAFVALGSTGTVSADWPTYHHDLARTGTDPTSPALNAASRIWSASLDGALYAEPVTIGTTVIAATENDTVYAFDTVSGRQLWHTHVASPLTGVKAATGCGDIDPLGITGTPAIDAASRTVYVVAEEASPTGQHELIGLDVGSGRVVSRVVVDGPMTLPNNSPLQQQQRGALAVNGGRVYIPFGGLAGDCGNYHGFVIAVDESGGALHSYEVAPNSRGGGIWAPSGMSLDGNGNVYVSTGNSDTTASTAAPDDSESVVKLSPTLTKVDIFTTSTWRADNAGDQDLGSTAPAQLDGGLAFAVGKNGSAYLLNANALGGTGKELFTGALCAAFGGTAYDGSNLYVPCTNGVTQVHVDTASRTFKKGWTQTSASKTPILAGGLVWSMSGSTLYGLDPGSGSIVTRLALTGTANSFVTPTADQGHLIAPAGTHLDVFTPPLGSMALMGTDSQLYARHATTGWIPLGGVLTGAPAVVPIPRGGGIVDLYIVVGTDSALWERTDAVGWRRFPSFTSCADNPAATLAGTTLVVACQGSDHALWVGSAPVDPNAPALPSVPGFVSLGGTTSFGPAVTVLNGTPTYFVVGTDAAVYARDANSGWGRFTGTSCTGHPAAASSGSVAFLACHGSDNALWYAVNGGAGWSGFSSIGGTVVDGPGVSAFAGEVAFTVEGVNGEVWQNVVTATSSTGWIDQFGQAQHGAAAASV